MGTLSYCLSVEPFNVRKHTMGNSGSGRTFHIWVLLFNRISQTHSEPKPGLGDKFATPGACSEAKQEEETVCNHFISHQYGTACAHAHSHRGLEFVAIPGRDLIWL